MAGPGFQYLMSNPRVQSARWRSLLRILTLSMLAAARDCRGRTFRLATESTGQFTQERHGNTWVCATASKLEQSSSTHVTLIASLSRCWDTPTAQTKSVESFDRPMAARPFRRFYTRMRTQGR